MPTELIELVAPMGDRAGLVISSHLSESLRLRPGRQVRLKAGVNTVTARVGVARGLQAHAVAIATPLRRRLGLPVGLRLHLRRADDGTLEFGPFLGILAKVIPRWAPYGEQNTDFKAHTAAGRQRHVVVFAFGLGDVDWRHGLIQARMYDVSAKRWRRTVMPIPHVVWNRGYWPGGRRLLIRTLKRLHQRGGAAIFNAGVGTKWQVYRILWNDPALRPYIPATARYRGLKSVTKFLALYPGVYMKPMWGGWGIGIIRIRRVGRGRYSLTRTLGRRGVNVYRVVDIRGLRAKLARLVHGGYLVQQELLLARIQGCIVDIRILAQRTSSGEWGITGAAARVGRPRSVISNLHGGGKALTLTTALARMFPNDPEKASQAEAKLRELTPQIVRQIERNYGRFGEIGLDFGIDRDGKVWFIEVNSRPGRNSFRTTSPEDIWTAASTHPVEYAQKLADFS